MKECQWRVTHNPEKEVQSDSEKKKHRNDAAAQHKILRK